MRAIVVSPATFPEAHGLGSLPGLRSSADEAACPASTPRRNDGEENHSGTMSLAIDDRILINHEKSTVPAAEACRITPSACSSTHFSRSMSYSTTAGPPPFISINAESRSFTATRPMRRLAWQPRRKCRNVKRPRSALLASAARAPRTEDISLIGDVPLAETELSIRPRRPCKQRPCAVNPGRLMADPVLHQLIGPDQIP
nr:hypothetical protein CFP56_20897 [Quercus suber]